MPANAWTSAAMFAASAPGPAASARAIPAMVTSDAAKVALDGPTSAPAAVSKETSARRDSGFARPFVTPTTKGRAASDPTASRRRRSSAPAPDWLTITRIPPAARAGTRKWTSSPVSIASASRPAPPRVLAAAPHAAAELPIPVSTIGAPGRCAAAISARRLAWPASADAARSIAAGWSRISASQASGGRTTELTPRP